MILEAPYLSLFWSQLASGHVGIRLPASPLQLLVLLRRHGSAQCLPARCLPRATFFVNGMHFKYIKQPTCSFPLKNLPHEPLDVHVRVPSRSKMVKKSVTLHNGDSGFACRNNENSSDLGTLSSHFHTEKYSWVFSLVLVTKEQ